MKVNPDGAGLDGSRLERITDHLARNYIEPGKIAGCQVAVSRHGELGYFRSLGSMDLERGREVGEDTIWRIYSMTKPITAVALLTLYERGYFQLTDDVSRFIPEWRDLMVAVKAEDGTVRLVPPARPMNVRDLLMHMAGLGFGLDPERLAALFQPSSQRSGLGAMWGEGSTLSTMVERLATEPLQWHPGTRWVYGVSTDVCGRLVEIISGRGFDEYLETEIFGPLGMHDTAFAVDDDKVGRLAASYLRGPDKKLRLVDDPDRSSYRRPPTFLSGGGGLLSTTADYLRFCRMLVNGGELDGVRILGRKTVEIMTINHLPGGGELRDFALPGGYGEVGMDGVGFGLTVAVNLGPAATATVGSAGEYMWGGAASTTFWVDPAEDLVVVFMTQLLPSGTFNFRGQLKTLIYPAIVD